MRDETIKNGVPVLERTIDMLGVFEREPEGSSIRDLTRELGLPRSTVYRILNTLLAHKLVRRASNGSFSLGPRLVSLAARVKADSSSYDLAEIATPVIQHLRDEIGEPVKLSVRDGDRAKVIVALLGRHEYSPAPATGTSYPLHAGAASKMIMAHMSAPDLARHLGAPMTRYTPKTITDPDKLRADLARIRKLGIAQDLGEHSTSVHAIAAPVFDPAGKFLAALSIPFLADKDAAFRDRLRQSIVRAATTISGKDSTSMTTPSYPRDLKGKVALVTGAGSGIGAATARQLAARGARVAALDVNNDRVAEIVGELGDGAIALVADVSSEAAMRTAFAKLQAEAGRLDIVVVNAGINGQWAPIDELSLAEWDRTIEINLRGTYLTIHLAVPMLKAAGAGAIVMVSSINGTRTFTTAGAVAYTATKGAQAAIAQQLALELGMHRIRVNTVCPGSTKTNIIESTFRRNLEAARVPVMFPVGDVPITGGKPALPEDIADSICFLVSDQSRHINGAVLHIDGGQSLLR